MKAGDVKTGEIVLVKLVACGDQVNSLVMFETVEGEKPTPCFAWIDGEYEVQPINPDLLPLCERLRDSLIGCEVIQCGEGTGYLKEIEKYCQALKDAEVILGPVEKDQ